MPTRPKKACAFPGCGAVTTARYCAEHQPKEEYGWDRFRPSGATTARGYGARWRRLRNLVLIRDHHMCVLCGLDGRIERATDVDHITPKSSGGTDAMDNLQSLCTRHHREKTGREAGGGAVPKKRLMSHVAGRTSQNNSLDYCRPMTLAKIMDLMIDSN